MGQIESSCRTSRQRTNRPRPWSLEQMGLDQPQIADDWIKPSTNLSEKRIGVDLSTYRLDPMSCNLMAAPTPLLSTSLRGPWRFGPRTAMSANLMTADPWPPQTGTKTSTLGFGRKPRWTQQLVPSPHPTRRHLVHTYERFDEGLFARLASEKPKNSITENKNIRSREKGHSCSKTGITELPPEIQKGNSET